MNFQTENSPFLNSDDIFSTNFNQHNKIETSINEETNNQLVLFKPNNYYNQSFTNNNTLIPYSNNKYYSYITIEEMEDTFSLSSNSVEPIIEEINNDNENTTNKINYSDYVYDIKMNDKCTTCNFDALTLIKNNEDMFHKFLNTNHKFQISMFSLIKNIIQTLDNN